MTHSGVTRTAEREVRRTTTEWIDCPHCNHTGTCSLNPGGKGCASCAKAHRFKNAVVIGPLICSVCEGKGSLEPFSLKLQNRYTPLLSGIFVGLTFVLLFTCIVVKSELFGEALGFAGAVIGGIVGYYFGDRQSG